MHGDSMAMCGAVLWNSLLKSSARHVIAVTGAVPSRAVGAMPCCAVLRCISGAVSLVSPLALWVLVSYGYGALSHGAGHDAGLMLRASLTVQ